MDNLWFETGYRNTGPRVGETTWSRFCPDCHAAITLVTDQSAVGKATNLDEFSGESEWRWHITYALMGTWLRHNCSCEDAATKTFL